jgi:hypothetical protein
MAMRLQDNLHPPFKLSSMTEPSQPTLSRVLTIDDLRGPAGHLEALLNTGNEAAPFSALVCHPHPAGGGTMHNKVVYHATKTLNSAGLPVLRFNFRGVGLSEGKHDNGRGEQDDVRAAIDWLAARLQKPILLAGFSFGSVMGLSVACGDPHIAGLIGLGLPVHAAGRDYSFDFLAHCTQPKLFISGDHDEFSSMHALQAAWQLASEPKRAILIPGADHFFQGTTDSPGAKLDQMQAAIRAWLADTFNL